MPSQPTSSESPAFRFAVPVYPITDEQISRLSQAEQVVRLAEGGARLIQLRAKAMAAGEFYWQAREALLAGRQHRVAIVINDRVDLALALGADGVHLGQDDLPAEAARDLLGEGAIIGLSTHNVKQALKAAKLPVDYLAIGPIFQTPTKVDAYPVVGLAGLREVRKAVGHKPLVAIGGITLDNHKQVMEAGANAIALIGGLLSQPGDISACLRKFLGGSRA